jgi:hypothetical protein
LVTPTLGVASATSVNKVALTAPATSATLTLANGSTLATSGAFSQTLTATATTAVTLPTSGTIMSSVTALSGAVTGTPSSTTYLRGDATWATVSGGGGTPGGSTTQVQYNNAGSFAGSANFVFDGNNVGIGVTPSAFDTVNALQILNGSIYGYSTNETGFSQNAYYASANWRYISTSAATAYRQVAGAHYWYIAPSGTAGNVISFGQAMTLNTSGNLGIGVTPSAWGSGTSVIDLNTGGLAGALSSSGTLSVASNGYFNGTNWIYKNSSYAQLYQMISGKHSWQIAPVGTAGNAITFTQAMTLDTSGNLGIGNTSPDAKISLGGSAGYFINLNDGNVIGVVAQTSGDVLYSGTYNAKSYGFLTSNTERMRIDTSGNLLVGATANGQPDANYFMARNATGFQANIGHATGTASGQPYVYMVYGGSAIGSITQSGTANVLYNVASDQRLKNDLGIVTTTNVIDKTIIHDYEWKLDGSKSRGVFAQEAYEVIPNAVNVGSDELNENNNIKNPWGVDYSKYVPDLIVYCQQLNKRIQELEAKLGV